MQYSIPYLAGVGAAALGLPQCDNPYPLSDHDGTGDFLNGFGDGPEPEEGDDCDICARLSDAKDDAETMADRIMDARHDLAKALDPAAYRDDVAPPLPRRSRCPRRRPHRGGSGSGQGTGGRLDALRC